MSVAVTVMVLCAGATLPWIMPEKQGRHLKIETEVNPKPVDLAVAADLVKAGLRAGASLPDALRALGKASGNEKLEIFGNALVIGVPWKICQTELPPHWHDFLAILEPAWESGVAAEALLSDYATKIRLERNQNSRKAAAQLATKLIVPLTVCLLPAFVLLGIVPVLWTNLTGLIW